jgi:hypothetical protein
VSGIGLLGGRLPALDCYAPRASVVVDLLRGRLLVEQRNRLANPLQSMFLQPLGE